MKLAVLHTIGSGPDWSDAPLDTGTMIGPQVSAQQLAKVSSYVDIGRADGAGVLIGGTRAASGGEFAGGYFYQPTVLKGHNKMRVFQEEIFGPVLAVTTFRDEADAIEIADDTLLGEATTAALRHLTAGHRESLLRRSRAASGRS